MLKGSGMKNYKLSKVISERIFDLERLKNREVEKHDKIDEMDFIARSISRRKIKELESMLQINKEIFIANQGQLQ